MRKTTLFSIFVLLIVSSASAKAEEKLPVLLEGAPERLYQMLGPVGAGMKDLSQARQQLRREARKLDADAVIQVRCESGGIKRQGLTWAKVRAYCRGMAVQWIEEKKKP